LDVDVPTRTLSGFAGSKRNGLQKIFFDLGLTIAGSFWLPILAAMAARASRVRCDNVANVVLASILSMTGLAGGCDGRDDIAGRIGDGSVGGTQGGGGGDDDGSSISCNPTGTGCLCIVADSQPGQLDACSPASIVQSETERGICCAAESLCTCLRYTCRSDPGSSFCQCASVSSLAGVTLGSAVADCPPPASGQTCCFSEDNATCICARLACAEGEVSVENCSAVTAGACRSGEDIAACR
jgi:hypothetical protein